MEVSFSCLASVKVLLTSTTHEQEHDLVYDMKELSIFADVSRVS